MVFWTFLTRWLICTNLYVLSHMNSFDLWKNHTNFMRWQIPNPAPNLNRYRNRKLYKFVRISHIVKYVWITCEIVLKMLVSMSQSENILSLPADECQSNIPIIYCKLICVKVMSCSQLSKHNNSVITIVLIMISI